MSVWSPRSLLRPGAPRSRRAVLRGLGAALTLPFLPSALPREAWSSPPPKAPLRLVVAVMPNGIYTPEFQPVTPGVKYDLPRILAPIAKLQSRFTVLKGVHNRAEEEAFPEHSPAMGTLLTDGTYNDNCDENTISFDQVAADRYGALTPFRSLQLTVKNVSGGGSSCIDKVSWGNNGTPFPPIEDPRAVYDRLFGVAEGLTEAEQQAMKTIRSSLLDRVAERAASIRGRLNAEDAQRLDQYETGLRELETRLDLLEDVQCEPPAQPDASPGYAEATKLQYELVHKALECDLSRYVTFLQGPSLSGEVYSFAGATQGLHTLSHSGWSAGSAQNEYINVGTWQMERFVELLELLAATPDVDGSDMLSNTICVITTEFAQSNLHLSYGPPESLAIGIAGGENAGIVQGKNRVFTGENTGNVWLALLNHLGVEQSEFGNHGRTPIDLTS